MVGFGEAVIDIWAGGGAEFLDHRREPGHITHANYTRHASGGQAGLLEQAKCLFPFIRRPTRIWISTDGGKEFIELRHSCRITGNTRFLDFEWLPG